MPNSHTKKKINTFEIDKSIFISGDDEEIIEKCFKIDCECI